MRNAMGKLRTVIALLVFCVRSPLLWAMPAISVLVAAGIIGFVSEVAATSTLLRHLL